MLRACRSHGAKAVALTSLLFAAPAAHAQSSALGHAPARATYPPSVYSGAPASRIYPGDKGFQATMKIEHYYQSVEHAPASRPLVRPTVVAEPTAAPVAVSVTGPAEHPEFVTIRGPGGDVRSFPLAKDREVIRPRTIVLRPGEKLTLVIGSARAQTGKK
jgi:hypothetical protein